MWKETCICLIHNNILIFADDYCSVFIYFMCIYNNSSFQNAPKVDNIHWFVWLWPRKRQLRTSRVFCDTGYQALVILFYSSCFYFYSFLQWFPAVSCPLGHFYCPFHSMWSVTTIPGLSKDFVLRKWEVMWSGHWH